MWLRLEGNNLTPPPPPPLDVGSYIFCATFNFTVYVFSVYLVLNLLLEIPAYQRSSNPRNVPAYQKSFNKRNIPAYQVFQPQEYTSFQKSSNHWNVPAYQKSTTKEMYQLTKSPPTTGM